MYVVQPLIASVLRFIGLFGVGERGGVQSGIIEALRMIPFAFFLFQKLKEHLKRSFVSAKKPVVSW